MYDIIGDIHGHANALVRLLERMGYRQRAGTWRHDDRQVIFLGDFIDRGSSQLETVRIARGMVEAGQALAVMGNHEFNAVAWATEDPDEPGKYLRPHCKKNRRQHDAFLQEVGEETDLHLEIIEWFRTLPLFLDLDGIRVIHACWHEDSMETLRDLMDAEGRLLPHAWVPTSRPGDPAFEAVETLIKGLEVPLPEGIGFHDKERTRRTRIRTRWWHEGPATYRTLALMPPDQIDQIPHDLVPTDILPGYDSDKPVFVGHYWLQGEPEPITDRIACLDYSVAASSGGKLCAYRWHGESRLTKANFVSVPA